MMSLAEFIGVIQRSPQSVKNVTRHLSIAEIREANKICWRMWLCSDHRRGDAENIQNLVEMAIGVVAEKYMPMPRSTLH